MEPALFQVLCTHELSINAMMECPLRSGRKRLEYNPDLVGEYLARIKAMYYRTRNHSCIVAYALGGDDAGNGYNMYKAYQWLKGVEKNRAIICTSAEGEWNTDL